MLQGKFNLKKQISFILAVALALTVWTGSVSPLSVFAETEPAVIEVEPNAAEIENEDGEPAPDNGGDTDADDTDTDNADDDAPVATSGNTKVDLQLDGGGEETCTCESFCSDPDCPLCKDDATQCFFYYCVCEALCDEDNINTECPICNEDYTSCVQAVEVPEIAAMAGGNVTDAATLRAAALSSGSGEIILDNDISITNAVSSAGLLIERPLTLDLNGYSLTITLDATTGETSNGIKIETDATLTIEDSSTSEAGKLTVTIGKGTGVITEGAGSAINATDGKLVIKSGTVEATGGYRGAGIGGGYAGDGGNIEIVGTAIVTAEGGSYAAGIGGGSYNSFGGKGGNIKIGGDAKVTATGGGGGAGIGGGYANIGNGHINGGNITISGNATVIAIGGGAGIGGGGGGNGGTITITGGTVEATGKGGAGIGGGYGANGETINISGGKVTAIGGDGGAGIGGGYKDSGNGGDGGTINISGDAVVVATGGVGDDSGAGIGGGYDGAGGPVTISGDADVTATGGDGGAGIGGGMIGASGTVIISDAAVVTATGVNGGTGIGGGRGGDGGNIEISSNAKVAATGSSGGAGIGGGGGSRGGDGGAVTITNADKVEAISGGNGSMAIGKGDQGTNNGTVTVTGPYEYWIDDENNEEPDAKTGSGVFTNDTDTFAGQEYVLLQSFVPTYGIELNPATDKDFGSVEYGYAAQTAHSVTVNNTGNQPTGALTVALSGTNAGSFTLSETDINSIAVDGSDSFTVVPNTGLAAGNYTATVTVSGGNGISKTFNVSFEVTKATQAALTITGLASPYTYGQAAITLGTTGGSSTGAVTYVSSDTSVATVSGNTVTIVGAGSFTITATKAGDGNYNDVSVTSSSVTVNKVMLTPTISFTGSTGKTYDGTTTIGGTAPTITLSGAVNSENPAATATIAFADANVSNNKNVNATGITLSGSWGDNYALSTNSLSNVTSGLDITAAPLTITGFSISKTYDGNNTVTGFGTLTFNGLQNSETATVDTTGITATYDNANVGASKAVTFSGSFGMTGGTATASNYTITQPTGVTGAISKAAAPTADISQTLTFTQGIADSKSVNLANLLPSLTSPASYGTVTYTAAITADSNSILSAPIAGTVSSPLSVGVKNTATDGNTATVTVTVSSTNYDNFTITINVGVTAKTATTVTVTAPSTGLTYGETLGNPSATADDGGSTFTYEYTGTLADGSSTAYGPIATPPTEPGNYIVTATLDSPTHTGTGTADFTISKKTLTWQTSGTAANKTYDGTATAAQATAPTLSGIINSDNVSVNAAGTLAFANANAGTGKAVTASGYGITGTDAWKYNAPIVQPGFGTANITAKAITITPDAGQNKDYGSTDPTLSYTPSENLITGNSFSGALSRVTGENVGTYAINLGTLSAGSNYTLTLSTSPVNFTINKAAYTGTKTASAEVRAGQVTTNKALILPTLPEGASYPASGTISGALVSSNSVNGRQLTYSTTSQAVGASATITIPVANATNYNAYDVIVTITARNATDAEKVAEDLDALTFADIKNANIVPNDVTTDLDLISAGTVHGSAISWMSNHSAINVTNGAVTRQSSDTAVVLTATITNGAATATKIFRLTVTAAPPPAGNIGGTVTDEGGTTPKPNLTVKIMIGGSINGTVVGSTITNASGVYGFTNLPYGVYSLVVYDGTNTVTRLIIINSTSVTENVKMPAGNQNTYVEVNGSDTPSVATGNLEEMFTPADIAAAQEAGASVEIKLVVEAVDNPPDANLVLQTLGSGKELGFYLNAELLKTITGSANDDVDGEKIQPPTGTTLTVVIDLPPELWNLEPYSIIRVHGSDVKTITPIYDSTLHTLTFDADLFSTYAIAYTSNNPSPPSPPSPPSGGGSSSGGNHNAATASAIISTYWIEKAEAKTMAKSAKEQGAEIARSRRSTITGIRKASLLLLSESGLRYQHDTVANNAVQVRVYVNDPSLATKDILVSGYVTGDTVDKTKAIFGKWYQNKIAVVSFDAQGDFGMKVEVAAKVDLSGMDTGNLYFYSYDKATNKYKRILTEYRIDASGYLHFATTLAGSIIITDAPLSGSAEPQNPGTGGDDAAWNTNDLHNPNTGGDGMITPPTQVQAQPQVSVTADTLPEAATVDSGTLKLESRTVPAAISNMDGEIGGALVFDLDAPAESAVSKKSNLWLFGGIGAILLLIAMTVLWAAIPRKDDPLASVQEYKKK